MKRNLLFTVLLGCAAGAALGQDYSGYAPSSGYARGDSKQAWQDPGQSDVLAQCSEAPEPFAIGGADVSFTDPPPPPAPALPVSEPIAGVIENGRQWRVVWAWEGNNADGPIAGEDGTLLFANNDASNAMQLDPQTGLARIIHSDTNTGGALSRSSNGALFVAMRGLNPGILQLEPERRIVADTFDGEPFDCVGGVVNDLSADSRGGVYLAVTGRGLFYADSEGTMREYGEGLTGANGIVLGPDEDILYVTNGPVVMAFDVEADGSLSGQREFARLRGGGGDGSAVDAEGRLYVATGSAVDVFAPEGEFLGSIPAPQGTHGVAFGGRDKRTLFGIVFYGPWGTSGARNQIVAIPTVAQGYQGRAK